MTTLSPTANHMCNSIDALAEQVQTLSTEIEAAANLLTQSLLEDKKLLVCGTGLSAPIAQILATGLMDQHEFERPGLPAINLSSDSVTVQSLVSSQNTSAIFSKQVQAIGMEGDGLVLFELNCDKNVIEEAIDVAQNKAMKVVLFCTNKRSEIITRNEMSVIHIEHTSLSQTLELMLLSSNTLIRSIESKLFGMPL